jgi:hypothetical protein
MAYSNQSKVHKGQTHHKLTNATTAFARDGDDFVIVEGTSYPLCNNVQSQERRNA